MRSKWLSLSMMHFVFGIGLSGCMQKDNGKMMDESMSAPMEDSMMKDDTMKKEGAMMEDDNMGSDMAEPMK